MKRFGSTLRRWTQVSKPRRVRPSWSGLVVNSKWALRAVRDRSLLCQLRRCVAQATDSEHSLRLYPNLRVVHLLGAHD